jgi:hypothetical protein
MLNKLLSVALVASFASFAFAASPAERAQALASQDSITSEQIAEIATSLGSPSYAVLYKGRGADHVEFGAGLLRLGDQGEYVTAGALPPGVYWNFSNEPVWLGNGDGTPDVEIPSNGLVVVAAAASAVSATDRLVLGGGPSVECGAGYYACCCQNNGGSSRTANCIANGSPSNCRGGAACTYGGPGATSCSFGGSAVAFDIREPVAPGNAGPGGVISPQ